MLQIEQYKYFPSIYKHDLKKGSEYADLIASKGDDFLFGGKGCQPVFSAVTKAIALGAFNPGGIDFLGVHYEVDFDPDFPY